MKNATLVLYLALVILAFIIGPAIAFWAIKTLFGIAIPYTFKTWLAAVLLGGSMKAGK